MKKILFVFCLFFFVSNVDSQQMTNKELGVLSHNQVGILDCWYECLVYNQRGLNQFESSDYGIDFIEVYISVDGGVNYFYVSGGSANSYQTGDKIFPLVSSVWGNVWDYNITAPQRNALYWHVNDKINSQNESDPFWVSQIGEVLSTEIHFKIKFNFTPSSNWQFMVGEDPTFLGSSVVVMGSFPWFGKFDVHQWPLCTNREYKFSDIFTFNDEGDNTTQRKVAFNDESVWGINNLGTADTVISLPNNTNSSNSPYFTVPHNVGSPNKFITYSKVIDQKTYFFRTKKYVWGRANVIENVEPIPVLNTSMSPQNLNSFFDWEGTQLQFWGAGTYSGASGTSYFMDPQISGPGIFSVNARTVNTEDGLTCYSNWKEQMVTVQQFANPGAFPESFDFQHTFGENGGNVGYRSSIGFVDDDELGMVILEDGFVEKENRSWTQVGGGKYHQVCAGKEYELKIANPNTSVGVSYQWRMLYGGSITNLGTGTTKVVEIPENIQLNVHQSAGLPVNFANSVNTIGYLHLQRDIIGGGKRYSLMLGDIVQVMFRRVNQDGSQTQWRSAFLGAVPQPEVEPLTSFCYDGEGGSGASLSADVIQSPFYADFPNSSLNMRSLRWNVNGLNNGVFEYTGSNVTIPVPDGVKVSSFGVLAQDSSYFEFYDGSNNITYDYFNAADITCKSNFETVNVIRDPEFTTNFSHLGTVTQGQPVLSVVSGSYFDTELDIIETQYSDGSPIYSGDSVWHYKNDLGDYDCFVRVEDSYGCFRERSYLNYWYVPGTLSLEEESELFLNVYPNPFTGGLTIEAVDQVDVNVYNASGALVRSFQNVNELDLYDVDSGVYYLHITTKSGDVVSQKVIKL